MKPTKVSYNRFVNLSEAQPKANEKGKRKVSNHNPTHFNNSLSFFSSKKLSDPSTSNSMMIVDQDITLQEPSSFTQQQLVSGNSCPKEKSRDQQANHKKIHPRGIGTHKNPSLPSPTSQPTHLNLLALPAPPPTTTMTPNPNSHTSTDDHTNITLPLVPFVQNPKPPNGKTKTASLYSGEERPRAVHRNGGT